MLPLNFKKLTHLRHFTAQINRGICRKVLISSSNDIYTNLSLEDWFYKNKKFDSDELLLIWRNNPCVVIGRHQNPWLECNLKYLQNNKISLARRNSGGGTVYHDLGNLNCTFFTDRKKYNRKKNLELICRAVAKKWNLDVGINSREDIVLNGEYKVSGTAAKLGNPSAYHHCTVLVDVDKKMLMNALDKENSDMESKATGSVRGTVKNLKDELQDVDFWSLVDVISKEYVENHSSPTNREIIIPEETHFPGLNKIRDHLANWDWIFGHTPRFTIRKQFTTTPDLSNLVRIQAQETEFQRDLSTTSNLHQPPTITLTLQVYRAKIESFSINPESFLPNDLLTTLQTSLITKLFKLENITQEMNSIFNSYKNPKIVFIVKCLQDMIKRA